MRLTYSAHRHSLNWFGILTLAVVALSTFFVVYPLIIIIKRAFFGESGLDVEGIVQLITDPAVAEVILNTISVVGVSGVFALLVGALFAWLNERTDADAGWISELLPLIPLLIPTIACVIGWVTLLSPQAGLLNALLRDLFSLVGINIRRGPVNIFTYTGFVFVMFLYLLPFSYLIISAALRNLDPALEEAARITGASPLRTFWKVTLPSIRPALAASALVLIIQGVANFSVPIVLGTGAGIDVLSVRIYQLLYAYPPKVDLAIIMSLFMMITAQTALILQRWISSSGRFATIGGKGSAASRIRLGRWRLPVRSAMIGYLLATSFVPVVGLLIVSLQPLWTARIVWGRLSLSNYTHILFERQMTSDALQNSLMLGMAGATIGMLIAALIALTVRNSPTWLQGPIDGMTVLPAAVPHSVMGVGFLFAFGQGWLNLHGTLAILLIVYLVMYLPQAVRSASAASAQVGRELVEAAAISRASPLTVFRRVQLPLMMPGLVAGWVILFVHCAGELTASALLSASNNPVVGLVLLDLWENGSFPQVAAMSIVVTMTFTIIVLVMLRYCRGGLRR
ncbi:Ferric iron ABC transporter, permease protein [Hyphomicrobiales bacterium]|nr:iron ABC transporter permease [Chelatococcus sp. HY11]CAH1652003.1 Ferric iron ABC transporter, permease protein [Hyphomicrobiales bacterium]CAH1693599.1 Ferric iron ABC transporter, permease protein [Hyphomicrobiales bacterium]